jgi:CRP-like cAMP-binding protein
MGKIAGKSKSSLTQHAFAQFDSPPVERRQTLSRSDAGRDFPGSPASRSEFAPLLRAARDHGMFSMLSEADAEILFSYCQFGFAESGIQLFSVGDLAEYMLFIIEGRANVDCSCSDNEVLRVGTVGTGAIIGESAITSISQRNASVVTASRCALGFLHYGDFNRLRIAHPETALRFLIMLFSQMNARMRAMVKQLTEANQVRIAAETSLDLLSKVLFDRRVGAPGQAADASPQLDRRRKSLRTFREA